MALPTPNLSRQHGGSILTYELPGRTYSSCVYPLRAPNGSSVILYAKDNAISVVWRGGKALKSKTKASAIKTNGTSKTDGSIMIIDSDDDMQTDEAEHEEIEFEEDQDDALMDQPDRIVASTTVELHATPLHLAVPPLCKNSRARSVQYGPKYCENNVTVAAACSDGSVRLVVIPIVPTLRKVQSAVAEIVVATDEHPYATPHGISFTFTMQDPSGYDLDDFDPARPSNSQEDEWDLLIAWHVSRPMAAFSVAQIPIETAKNKRILGRPRHRTYYLPSPLVSLSFNPAARQLNRHTQLVCADEEGSIRICNLRFVPKTTPSGIVQQELARLPIWLGTFYVPFNSSPPKIGRAPALPRRKAILGAEWALDGRCIIVMLDDGSWGLWDLEGARPETPGSQKARSVQGGVWGGGVTQFTLRGNLTTRSNSPADTPEDRKSAREPMIGEKRLAPMTPNTRKAKQNNFLDKAPNHMFDTSGISKGGISVSRPSEPVANAPYETVLFWFNEAIYSIPNFMLYWQRAAHAAGGSNLGSIRATIIGPNPLFLSEVSTMGEAVTSVSQLPAYSDMSLSSYQRLEHDFVVAGEHRLVFFCPSKPQIVGGSSEPTAETYSLANEPSLNNDEQLLARGELGLAGLDRLMDGMDSESGLFGHNARSRKVGFAA